MATRLGTRSFEHGACAFKHVTHIGQSHSLDIKRLRLGHFLHKDPRDVSPRRNSLDHADSVFVVLPACWKVSSEV